MTDEKLSRQSQAILAKLVAHQHGRTALTDLEIERIRKNFEKEDTRTAAGKFIYNFVTKLAGFLVAVATIWGAISWLKGLGKLW
jgi:hypothetical protein